MTSPQPARPRWATLRWAGLVAFMLGGLALFGALIYLSGPAQVFADIKKVGVVGFLAVVLSVLASMLTWALSWHALLRGAGIAVPWHRTVSPLLAGFAVTYLTPSMYIGGEPVRANWVARDQGIPMARVMATVIAERILSGFSVLAFASIGAVLTLISPGVSVADKAVVGIALGTLALILLAAVALLARDIRWISRFLRWLARYLPGRERLLRAAGHVAEMEAEIHRAFTLYRSYTLFAFALQLLTVFLNYVRPQIFFYFTQGDLFTFPQLSLYFTLSLFVNAFLWVTPGGFGITDGGRVGVFSLLGVPLSAAVAFNVLFRFVDLILVGFGVQLLLRRGLLQLRRGRVAMTVDSTSPESKDSPPTDARLR